MNTAKNSSNYQYTGVDEFTGQSYAFDLYGVKILKNFEDTGADMITATLVTAKGQCEINEWVNDGEIARTDSNILTSDESNEINELLGFEYPRLDPYPQVPDAIFDALQEKYDEIVEQDYDAPQVGLTTEKDALTEALAYYEAQRAEKYKKAFHGKTGRGVPTVDQWKGVQSFEKFLTRAITEGTEWRCEPTTEPLEFDKQCVKLNKLNTELTDENPRPGVYRISLAAADIVRAGKENFVTVDYRGETVAVTLEQAYARNLREQPHEWVSSGNHATLEPCPHCNGDAVFINTLETGANDDPPDCHVYCTECGAMGPRIYMNGLDPLDEDIMETASDAIATAKKQAIAGWNLRITH